MNNKEMYLQKIIWNSTKIHNGLTASIWHIMFYPHKFFHFFFLYLQLSLVLSLSPLFYTLVPSLFSVFLLVHILFFFFLSFTIFLPRSYTLSLSPLLPRTISNCSVFVSLLIFIIKRVSCSGENDVIRSEIRLGFGQY